MTKSFEELDYRPTAIGTLSLRRRRLPGLSTDVYEIKLADDFLMSSLFTVAETELARLGLAETPGEQLAVIVGGLGLGYTARAVLENARVGSLTVVEALAPVIEWHRQGLLPLGPLLTADPRCRFVEGDFFAMMRVTPPANGARQTDAILVDIDHSPGKVLHSSHAGFYEVDGLRRLAAHLQPHGVLGLWSDDPPDESFVARLAAVFTTVEAHIVTFRHPLQDREAANTVYVARAVLPIP